MKRRVDLQCLGWAVSIGRIAASLHAGDLPSGDHSARWQKTVDDAVSNVLQQPWKSPLGSDQIAVTLVDLADPARPIWASYRGGERIYPASVVKLFYLVAIHRWLEDGKTKDTAELRRAMHDMIVESYNEATHYVIDVLTDTTSGPELSEPAIRDWFDRRNAVNRYFISMGYTGVNANKKPWCEGPYGRETQAIRLFEPKRNELTTEDTAHLVTEIALGKSVNAKRSLEMLELLKRDPWSTVADPEDQARDFSGLALKPGMRLWSKAGWTSETRHDAALIELAGGHRLVTVVFTVDHASEREIIPALVRPLIAAALEGGSK